MAGEIRNALIIVTHVMAPTANEVSFDRVALSKVNRGWSGRRMYGAHKHLS